MAVKFWISVECRTDPLPAAWMQNSHLFCMVIVVCVNARVVSLYSFTRLVGAAEAILVPSLQAQTTGHSVRSYLS